MKNSLQKLKSFSNSTYNSVEENEFMEKTMTAFYDEKLKRKYKSLLENDHNLIQAEKDAEVKGKSNSLKIVLIILGSIIALAIAAFFISKLGDEQNYQVADNLNAYYTEIDFNTRGELSIEEKLVELGKYYDEKNFIGVSELYTSLELSTLDDKYLHAIGVSLLNNDRLEEAIVVWNVLLDKEETRYSYHNVARWFMGRAMLESGVNVEDGKAILNEVSSESQYYENAQDLIK